MAVAYSASSSAALVLRAPPALRTEMARRVFFFSSSLSTTIPATTRNFFSHGAIRPAFPPTPTRRSAGLLSLQIPPAPRDASQSFIRPLLRRAQPQRLQSTTANTADAPTASPTEEEPSTTNSKPPPHLLLRLLLNTTLFALAATFGFAMAAAPAAEAINGWVNAPSDAETLSLVSPETAEAQKIETALAALPLIQTLRADPTKTESRPHLKIAPGMRPHSLTAGVLMADGCLGTPPVHFLTADGPHGPGLPALVQVFHLGPRLCGHPGLVHGGLLATMLDEGLARCCFPALPNKIGVTASLKIDYRAPCPADRFVVLKAETTKVEGRKAWVKGWIEVLDAEGRDGDGVKVVEAEALFIEPKQAKNMARLVGSQA